MTIDTLRQLFDEKIDPISKRMTELAKVQSECGSSIKKIESDLAKERTSRKHEIEQVRSEFIQKLELAKDSQGSTVGSDSGSSAHLPASKYRKKSRNEKTIGSWPRDSRKAIIEAEAKVIVTNLGVQHQLEDYYAPGKRTSVVKLKFC